MTRILDKQVTLNIFSTYSAKGMHPEHDELTMTFFQALLRMKDVVNNFRKAGYQVDVLKTYGSGLAEMPMRFIANKRTRYGKEYHHYDIEM